MTCLKNKKIDKILIVKPSSLGDIFHCFPAAALLRDAFPEAQFDWFIRPELKDALLYSPVKINRVINFPRRRMNKVKSFLPAFLEVINDLRKEKYDLIVDFQGLLRSAIFTSLCRSSQTVGFALPRESAARLAYRKKISIPPKCVHAVDRNIALAEAITGLKAPATLPALPEVKEFREPLSAILKKHNINTGDKLLGMIPGARWNSKRWPPEFFAGIAKAFLAENPEWKILIIGAPDDRVIAERIINSAACENLVSIAGDTSVGEMIEAIRRCRFIFSNDSGPVHVAAAFSKTVFAVFGPTDPAKTGPYGDFHYIFQNKLKCIKCLKRDCPDGSYSCHNLDISKLTGTLNDYLKSGEKHEN
ncbi:MAG: lipopolysaccharide heptosyltransferase II [Victivallaceae bacterium]